MNRDNPSELFPVVDETDGGRFWTIGEILRTLGTGLFTPNFESEFRRVFLTDDGIA